MKYLLQVKEEGDLEWRTLNSSYSKDELKKAQLRWSQTEYPLASFRIVKSHDF